jgi:hypothetical protein
MDATQLGIAETQLTIATLVSMLLQWIKLNPKFLPWINAGSSLINRLAATVLAALTAGGIVFTWNAGTHTATFANVTLASVAMACWAIAKQYTFQHLSYKLMYPKA